LIVNSAVRIFCKRQMPIVIAIAGRIGSGKTTLSKDLANALQCMRASFGDYVRGAVQERGLPPTRENLQVIGTQLLIGDPRRFCSSVLSSCGWQPGKDLVIDGLRHIMTIPIIRRLVEPAAMKIVYVSVPEEIRLQRLKDRGEGDARNVARIESHSSELELEPIAQLAELAVRGDKPREANVAEIAAWLRDQ
jgi:dephospho-CoA kinase